MRRRTQGSKALTAVDLQILLALARGPLHGYGIKLDVARRTEGEMSMGSGTLYEAIQRLEQHAFIGETCPPPGGAEVDPRRRYYRLEAAGERALREELQRLATVLRYGRTLSLALESGEG